MRNQTQQRINEGFRGVTVDLGSENKKVGVGNLRDMQEFVTNSGTGKETDFSFHSTISLINLSLLAHLKFLPEVLVL